MGVYYIGVKASQLCIAGARQLAREQLLRTPRLLIPCPPYVSGSIWRSFRLEGNFPPT